MRDKYNQAMDEVASYREAASILQSILYGYANFQIQASDTTKECLREAIWYLYDRAEGKATRRVR